jgi:hypothetical protein
MAKVLRELADPAHKTTVAGRPLTCVCRRSFDTSVALHVHQLKPWLSDLEIAAWNGDPNA